MNSKVSTVFDRLDSATRMEALQLQQNMRAIQVEFTHKLHTLELLKDEKSIQQKKELSLMANEINSVLKQLQDLISSPMTEKHTKQEVSNTHPGPLSNIKEMITLHAKQMVEIKKMFD